MSGFGFGGTNCHVILEEAAKQEIVRNEPDRPLHLFAIGAKNEPALLQWRSDIENYLASHSDADLGDVCFTANTGRPHGDHRLAVIGETVGQMRASLQSFITDQEDDNVARGKVQSKRRGEPAVCVDVDADLRELAVLYVSGAQVDWAGFDRDYRRYPVVLPTYPFQRQRHWVD